MSLGSLSLEFRATQLGSKLAFGEGGKDQTQKSGIWSGRFRDENFTVKFLGFRYAAEKGHRSFGDGHQLYKDTTNSSFNSVPDEFTESRTAAQSRKSNKGLVQAGHVCVGWLNTNQSRIIPVHLLDNHDLSIFRLISTRTEWRAPHTSLLPLYWNTVWLCCPTRWRCVVCGSQCVCLCMCVMEDMRKRVVYVYALFWQCFVFVIGVIIVGKLLICWVNVLLFTLHLFYVYLANWKATYVLQCHWSLIQSTGKQSLYEHNIFLHLYSMFCFPKAV